MTITVARVFHKALHLRADLYHFHDPELMPVGLLLKLITRKKIVYDVHEDYSTQTLSKEYMPRLLRKSIAQAIRMLEYLFSHCFDGIIAATDDILSNFSFHKRAISVKNFPMMSLFTNIKKKKSDHFFRVVYAGIIAEIRGTSQIIRAMHHISSDRKAKLILCGRFSPRDYEWEIKKLKGYEKVENYGWVEPHAVPELLSIADVGLVCLPPLPNYISSLPIKIFEYMAAGIPVIASDFPLWREIIDGAGCGLLVDPLDPKAISEAIIYIFEHPKEAEEMGKRGGKAIEEQYNWQNEEKKLLHLYERLLG
jgi:glycosyltransferase involved in cell wall biosynthesis